MKGMELRGATRGKPVKTTVSSRTEACPRDLVNRQFTASRPNALWLSDFTYVATWNGFVYVAFVIEPLPGASSAGGAAGRPTRASFSTPWNRPCTPAASRPSNGWTGSTIAVFSSRSDISRRPRRNGDTMSSETRQRRRDSNQHSSDKPGAVQARILNRVWEAA